MEKTVRANHSRHDLTEGPILKTALLYAIPILISALIQYLYNVFDTMMVGQFLGKTEMAAVNAAGTTSGAVGSLIGGFTAGSAVIIGISFGAKEKQKTFAAVCVFQKLNLIVGVLLTTLGLALAVPLLKITNVPDDCFGYSETYLLIVMGGAVVNTVNMAETNLLRTLGDSRSPVIMLIASAVINVLLNLLFMLVFRWGVAGVAVATVLSQLVSGALALFFFLRNFPEYNFFRHKSEAVNENLWLSEIRMAIPMALQMSLIMIGALIVQAKLNSMGKEIMAAFACGVSITNLAGTVINTFGTVITGFVAQNYGAKNFTRMKKGILYIMAASFAITVSIGVAILLFSRTVAGWFINAEDWTEEIYANVRTFILINVSFYPVWVPVPILRGAIQSMKYSLLPFLSCMVELPMRCITAWVLGSYFGFTGLAFSTPCALVAALLFLLAAFFVTWNVRKKQALQTQALQTPPAPLPNSSDFPNSSDLPAPLRGKTE